jgi:3-oxoacyl-[acyl-carrier protein] reductase
MTEATAPGASPRSLTGRVALVTGAASGIGRATAELFAADGCAVGCLDRSADALAITVDELTEAGGRAAGEVVDVADADAFRTAIAHLRDALGPVDIVVHAAGIPAGGPLDAAGFEEAWERAMAVNLTAAITMVRACLADLQRNGDGRIVNVASSEGISAGTGSTAYTASKHGIVGLTRSLAVDLGRTGVTANAVCPGPILTGMTAGLPEDARDTFARRRVPVRRYGRPEEVAHMIWALALPGASYVNGAIIPVDGGLTTRSR